MQPEVGAGDTGNQKSLDEPSPSGLVGHPSHRVPVPNRLYPLPGGVPSYHLGCVLLRCFQLDLDLGTRRVPRLADVWVG